MQKRGKYFGFLAIVWFGVSHFCQSKKYCLSPKELTIPIYLSSLFIKIQLSFKAVAATGYTYRAQRYDKTAEIPSASHQKINVNVCMSVFCTPIPFHLPGVCTCYPGGSARVTSRGVQLSPRRVRPSRTFPPPQPDSQGAEVWRSLSSRVWRCEANHKVFSLFFHHDG